LSEANDPKYADYDATKPTKYIQYWDVNNLYGLEITRALPYGNFVWLRGDQCEALEDLVRLGYDKESPCGKSYFFEVDLDYPAMLHDVHNDLPLCPEKMKVKQSMLSETQAVIHRQYFRDRYSETAKHVANLMPKKKYVLHESMLHEALNKGLVVTKWHRGISFTQKAFMAPYINHNNQMRAQVPEGDDFERYLWKLLNNAVRFSLNM
jgi:hypothetical protein